MSKQYIMSFWFMLAPLLLVAFGVARFWLTLTEKQDSRQMEMASSPFEKEKQIASDALAAYQNQEKKQNNVLIEIKRTLESFGNSRHQTR